MPRAVSPSSKSIAIGQAIAGRIFIPSRLDFLFETESTQNLILFPISEAGKAMARDIGYYTGSERP